MRLVHLLACLSRWWSLRLEWTELFQAGKKIILHTQLDTTAVWERRGRLLCRGIAEKIHADSHLWSGIRCITGRKDRHHFSQISYDIYLYLELFLRMASSRVFFLSINHSRTKFQSASDPFCQRHQDGAVQFHIWRLLRLFSGCRQAATHHRWRCCPEQATTPGYHRYLWLHATKKKRTPT